MPFFPLLALRFESSEHGPVVIEVEDGSPLAKAGLKSGDLVLSVLGKPVRTPGDFAKQIDLAVKDLASHDVVLKVQRGKELVDVKLTQAKTAPKRPRADQRRVASSRTRQRRAGVANREPSGR